MRTSVKEKGTQDNFESEFAGQSIFDAFYHLIHNEFNNDEWKKEEKLLKIVGLKKGPFAKSRMRLCRLFIGENQEPLPLFQEFILLRSKEVMPFVPKPTKGKNEKFNFTKWTSRSISANAIRCLPFLFFLNEQLKSFGKSEQLKKTSKGLGSIVPIGEWNTRRFVSFDATKKQSSVHLRTASSYIDITNDPGKVNVMSCVITLLRHEKPPSP